jgi:hypothetical protein
MNPVLKTIFGSIARHWLGALLGLLVGRGLMSHEDASSAVDLFTNDMTSNLIMSFLVAVLPATWSFFGRRMLKLREMVALRIHRGADPGDVKRVITCSPFGSRMAAVVTANPDRLTGCVGGEAHRADQATT